MKVGSPEWTLTIARLFGLSPAEIVGDPDHVRIGHTTYRIDRGVVLLDDQVVRDEYPARYGRRRAPLVQ